MLWVTVSVLLTVRLLGFVSSISGGLIHLTTCRGFSDFHDHTGELWPRAV
jgi:hypothetical protein